MARRTARATQIDRASRVRCTLTRARRWHPCRLGRGLGPQSGSVPDVDPGSFTAEQALRWGAVAEVLPIEKVLARAQELAEDLAAKPQLLTRYMAVTLRQRLSRRMAEGTQLGLALEGLTAADLDQH